MLLRWMRVVAAELVNSAITAPEPSHRLPGRPRGRRQLSGLGEEHLSGELGGVDAADHRMDARPAGHTSGAHGPGARAGHTDWSHGNVVRNG